MLIPAADMDFNFVFMYVFIVIEIPLNSAYFYIVILYFLIILLFILLFYIICLAVQILLSSYEAVLTCTFLNVPSHFLKTYFVSYWASQVAEWVKSPPAGAGNAGDAGSIPGWGQPPGEGNGSPLQYSCLENPVDGGDWRAVHGLAESDMTEHACRHTIDNIQKDSENKFPLF